MTEHDSELEPLIVLESKCKVTLPNVVREDREALRLMYHQVGDLLAEHEHDEWMIQDIEHRLGGLSCDLIDGAVERMADAALFPDLAAKAKAKEDAD